MKLEQIDRNEAEYENYFENEDAWSDDGYEEAMEEEYQAEKDA